MVNTFYQAFEGSLCVPDALYKTAFQLFDTNGNGTVCSKHILPFILHFICLFRLASMNLWGFSRKQPFTKRSPLPMTVTLWSFTLGRRESGISPTPSSANFSMISMKSKHTKNNWNEWSGDCVESTLLTLEMMIFKWYSNGEYQVRQCCLQEQGPRWDRLHIFFRLWRHSYQYKVSIPLTNPDP